MMRVYAGVNYRDDYAVAVSDLLRLRQLQDAQRGLRNVRPPDALAEVAADCPSQRIENLDRRIVELEVLTQFSNRGRSVEIEVLDVRIVANVLQQLLRRGVQRIAVNGVGHLLRYGSADENDAADVIVDGA